VTVTDALREQIAAVPFTDHHVHAPYERAGAIAAITADDFRRPWTEASIPAVWGEQIASSLAYRGMVRALAALLDVEPTEAATIAARNATAPATYHRLLADDAGLGPCYADDLFAVGQCYDIGAWAGLIGRPVRRVLRVEVFVQGCMDDCGELDDALHRLTGEIRAARERGIIALKSIAAYRSGLAIAPPTPERSREAREAYRRTRETPGRRIAAKPLVDAVVWAALEAAAPLRLPVQFHVAVGDDDIVLPDNDPALLRAVFAHAPFRAVPLVLLHCYPFHRHAGYLASIYPNVYVDLGLTIPLVGPRAAAIIAETLELAPTRHLLASTDGHMEPEFQWYGVRVWRRALASLLGRYVDDDALTGAEAGEIAAAILRDNAVRVYGE